MFQRCCKVGDFITEMLYEHLLKLQISPCKISDSTSFDMIYEKLLFWKQLKAHMGNSSIRNCFYSELFFDFSKVRFSDTDFKIFFNKLEICIQK